MTSGINVNTDQIGVGYTLAENINSFKRYASYIDLKFIGAINHFFFFIDRSNLLYDTRHSLVNIEHLQLKYCYRLYFNNIECADSGIVTNTSFEAAYLKPIIRINSINITKVEYLGPGT